MTKREAGREAFLRRMAQWYDEMVARAGLESGDTFDDIEEQAETRGREVTRELLRARLAAEEAAQHQEVMCPQCGQPMRRPDQAQPRHLDTASGSVLYHRRHAICDRCGSSFSPSGPPSADSAPGRVEPPPAQGL